MVSHPLKAEGFKSDVSYPGSSFVRKYEDDGLVVYHWPMAWDSWMPFCLPPQIMLVLFSKILVTFMHTGVNT